MNHTRVVYWFNPLVWYALKEMRNDGEKDPFEAWNADQTLQSAMNSFVH